MSHSSVSPTSQKGLNKRELVLIGITAIWGASFFLIHASMQVCGPLFFVGIRFGTAGLISLALFHKSLKHITRLEWIAGLSIGVCITLGYGLQTMGLQTISSSRSAFMTALYVPIVPILQWVIFRRSLSLMGWLGVLLAFSGLILLSNQGLDDFSISRGEIYTLLCTVAIAGEIILIGQFAGNVNVRNVTTIQLLMASLLSFALMPVAGEPAPAFSWIWVSTGLALGAASILIQWAMNWAQRAVSATRATLIYAGEPVWGGLFGRLAGDRLPAISLLGAGLIVLGVVVSELKLPRRSKHAIAKGKVGE